MQTLLFVSVTVWRANLPRSAQIKPDQRRSCQISANQPRGGQISPDQPRSGQISPDRPKSAQISPDHPDQLRSDQISPDQLISVQKCVKTATWRPPGATFEPEARNCLKRPPGSLLELLLSLLPEMLQNGYLEASWIYF